MRPQRLLQSGLREARERFSPETHTTVLGLAGLFAFLLYLVVTSLSSDAPDSSQATAIAGFAVCGALGMALALTKLDWCIFLTFLLVPAYMHPIGQGARTGGPWEVFLFCSAFGLLARRLSGQAPEEEEAPRGNLEQMVDVVILAFVASDVLSSLGALVRRGYMPGVWIRAIEGAMLYWLARDMLSRPSSARRLLKYIAISGAFQALVGLAQHFQLFPYHIEVGGYVRKERWYDRAYLMRFVGQSQAICAQGTLNHFNMFANFVNLCWPAALALALSARDRVSRNRWLGVATACVAAVIWSYSRAGLAAMVVAMVVWLCIVPRGPKAGGYRVFAAAMVILAAGWWHWAQTDEEYSRTLNLEDRQRRWEELQPADAFELVLGRGARATGETGMGAHNTYVLFRHENGLVGLTVFIAAGIIGLLIPLVQVARAPTIGFPELIKAAGVAALTTFYVHGYTDHAYICEPNKVWFLMSFCLASAPWSLALAPSTDEGEARPLRLMRSARTPHLGTNGPGAPSDVHEG